jgi:hypothetical protein
VSVAVLIPWRDVQCKHRERALTWVVAQLAQHGWPVVIGHHETGAWCKALAVNDALAQTDAEVLVVHDADVLTDGLSEAVLRVQEGARWAIPHQQVCRLTEASTGLFMAGEPVADLKLSERAYSGVEGGGITVLRREVYESCPLDPRFLGWGGEDESHAFALRRLHGAPWRGRAPLAHLWHPPQPRITRNVGSAESRELRKRYARARTREQAMSALVKEAHDAFSTLEPRVDASPALR